MRLYVCSTHTGSAACYAIRVCESLGTSYQRCTAYTHRLLNWISVMNKRTATKEEIRQYDREYYQRTKARRDEIKTETRRRHREAWEHLRSHYKCSMCSESHPATLQFHHTDPTQKEYNIGDMVNKGVGLERIKKEIEKCIPVCANCHFKIHWNERRSVA